MAIPRALRTLLQPVQLFTGAKSFEENVFLGSPLLNRWGLHATRVSLAHRFAESRRRRLADRLDAADRAAFDANGFVCRPDFLPNDQFQSLVEELERFRGRVQTKEEGASLLRKVAVDATVRATVPTLEKVDSSATLQGIVRYVGARDAAPTLWLQSVHQRPNRGAPDPQSSLHADTFHPTVKAWLFLSDVAADEGAFTYVPGSHRLTRERLAWERATSLVARDSTDAMTREGSFRIDASALPSLGLPEPKPIAVRANTLVVADTFGFHARGVSVRPSHRFEVWAIGRRNPFLPFTSLDRAVAAIGAVHRGADHWDVSANARFLERELDASAVVAT